jgi:hypothetical protein
MVDSQKFVCDPHKKREAHGCVDVVEKDGGKLARNPAVDRWLLRSMEYILIC